MTWKEAQIVHLGQAWVEVRRHTLSPHICPLGTRDMGRRPQKGEEKEAANEELTGFSSTADAHGPWCPLATACEGCCSELRPGSEEDVPAVSQLLPAP